LFEALQIYRQDFRPSSSLTRPYAMACIGVFAAHSDREARRLFTSLQQSFVRLRRGQPVPLPPPVDSMEGRWSVAEKAMVDHAFRESIVGSPDTVRKGITAFLERTGVDELMVTGAIYDHAARVRSLELTAEVRNALVER